MLQIALSQLQLIKDMNLPRKLERNSLNSMLVRGNRMTRRIIVMLTSSSANLDSDHINLNFK